MDEKIYPDAFHLHEALHMALFLAEAVEAQLVEHTYVKAQPQAAALANQAAETLQELYQLIGSQRDDI